MSEVLFEISRLNSIIKKIITTLAAPMVFISGGVGLTPLVSMLQDLLEIDFSHPITWLHGCRNRSVHAFKAQVDDVIAKHNNIVQHIFYDETTELDRQEGVLEGFLDLQKITSPLDQADAKYCDLNDLN